MASPDIYNAFKARLDAEFTALPVKYENENVETLTAEGRKFVYVEIFEDDQQQASIGAPGHNLWREEGSAFFHVMGRFGDGTLDLRTHAKTILTLFRERPLIAANGDQIVMSKISIGAGQPAEDFATYFAMTATVTWHRLNKTGT